MPKIVHVIPPAGTGGDRHQEEFQDNMNPSELLALIGVRSRKYGLLKVGEESMFYLDHPGTVVTFGMIDKQNNFKPTEEIDKEEIRKAIAEFVQVFG